MSKLEKLKQAVENLKEDLDTYLSDVELQVEQEVYDDEDIENSEWCMQIADIYKAAHGSELVL